MTFTARGTFAVTFRPAGDLPSVLPGTSAVVFDKVWTGDLTGHSQGHMLAHGQTVYVALEVFTGELVLGTGAPRQGQFVFAHLGEAASGQQRLTYRIAEGSGTGELSGIQGDLTLTRTGSVHHYEVCGTL